MVKRVGNRFLSIMLAIVMVLSLFPIIEMPVAAADVGNGSGTWIDGKLTYSYSVTT